MSPPPAPVQVQVPSGSDNFLPGTTANSLTPDAGLLGSFYTMTAADLKTKIVYNGVHTTIGDVVRQFQNLPPNQVAQWESNLIAAGLQAANTVGNPVSRTDAFNAFLRILYTQQQNNPQAPTDTSGLLQQLIDENPGAAIGARAAKAASAVRVHLDLSNPLDVKQLGDTVAQKLVGRDLTAQEAMDITNTIRAQQTSSAQGELSAEQSMLQAQSASQSAIATGQAPPDSANAGSGLIATQAATSPEAATTQYLTQNNPGDVQAHALLNVFEAIKSKVETDAQGSGPKAAVGPMRVI